MKFYAKFCYSIEQIFVKISCLLKSAPSFWYGFHFGFSNYTPHYGIITGGGGGGGGGI